MENLTLLPILPICEVDAEYHIVCAGYVALIFRNNNRLILNVEGP